MCRWLAYCGSPVLLEKALYAPAHSLIEQSLHSTLGAEATNGDGFGIGWYDDQPLPGVWNEVPESSRGVVGRGEDHIEPFVVKPPATSVAVGA